MPSHNPALNEATFVRERVVTVDPLGVARPRTGTMTLDGVVQKTAMLLALLVGAAVVGWHAVERTDGRVGLPAWLPVAALVAFAVALVTIFRPR